MYSYHIKSSKYIFFKITVDRSDIKTTIKFKPIYSVHSIHNLIPIKSPSPLDNQQSASLKKLMSRSAFTQYIGLSASLKLKSRICQTIRQPSVKRSFRYYHIIFGCANRLEVLWHRRTSNTHSPHKPTCYANQMAIKAPASEQRLIVNLTIPQPSALSAKLAREGEWENERVWERKGGDVERNWRKRLWEKLACTHLLTEHKHACLCIMHGYALFV